MMMMGGVTIIRFVIFVMTLFSWGGVRTSNNNNRSHSTTMMMAQASEFTTQRIASNVETEYINVLLIGDPKECSSSLYHLLLIPLTTKKLIPTTTNVSKHATCAHTQPQSTISEINEHFLRRFDGPKYDRPRLRHAAWKWLQLGRHRLHQPKRKN